jgi:hypothetical protein
MKKPLIALFALALTLPLGCSSEEDPPPDPLAQRSGFCQAWAERACQTDVVENCNANSVEDCQATQAELCRSLVPDSYASGHAGQCLDAVGAAYADAKLTPDEIAVVTALAAPCDELSNGSVSDGASCSLDDQCNTSEGIHCIKKLGEAKGVCELPEEVGPGEACDGPAQVCKSGYYCNGENCVAYKKSGAVCEGDFQCKPQERCLKEADAETGTCDARLELNAACTSSDECASGYCAIADSADAGECASTIVLTRTEPLCKTLR